MGLFLFPRAYWDAKYLPVQSTDDLLPVFVVNASKQRQRRTRTEPSEHARASSLAWVFRMFTPTAPELSLTEETGTSASRRGGEYKGADIRSIGELPLIPGPPTHMFDCPGTLNRSGGLDAWMQTHMTDCPTGPPPLSFEPYSNCQISPVKPFKRKMLVHSSLLHPHFGPFQLVPLPPGDYSSFKRCPSVLTPHHGLSPCGQSTTCRMKPCEECDRRRARGHGISRSRRGP